MDKFISRDKIVGKQVIDGKGITLGTVQDIAFDLPGGKMSITITNEKGKETEVVSDDVIAVGDVILLQGVGREKVVETPQTPLPAPLPEVAPTAKPAPVFKAPASPGLCPNCSYQNDVNSRFCIKCGTRLK